MKSANTSTTNTVVPMKKTLLGVLAMTWAWGVIAGSVGLNALIKSNQTQSRFRRQVPGAILIINVKDVFQSGVVLTTVSALIALLCTIFSLMLFIPSTRGIATRSLRIQSFVLAFCATWLFATLIPFTVFVANRSAKITAIIGGITLLPQAIQATEQALGTTSVYRKIGYLRLVAILPWFTFMFTVIAAIVLFMAGSRARRDGVPSQPATTRDSHSDAGTVEKDAGHTEKTT